MRDWIHFNFDNNGAGTRSPPGRAPSGPRFLVLSLEVNPLSDHATVLAVFGDDDARGLHDVMDLVAVLVELLLDRLHRFRSLDRSLSGTACPSLSTSMTHDHAS